MSDKDTCMGTFECPICGRDTPHSHSADESIRWHQVYRPIFEEVVFEQLQTFGSDIYMMDKQGYYLAFPASQYRDQHGWGKLNSANGEYHWPWVQALWLTFKEGVQAAWSHLSAALAAKDAEIARLRQALEQIRKGDNSPRTVAMAALSQSSQAQTEQEKSC